MEMTWHITDSPHSPPRIRVQRQGLSKWGRVAEILPEHFRVMIRLCLLDIRDEAIL